MRDAFGGISNLVIIVVFMTLVSGYLAFNVNYTKAFRVKNKIITLFEQYEGKCGGGPSTVECNQKIKDYMKQVGYSTSNFNSYSGMIDGHERDYSCQDGYCFYKVDVSSPSDLEQKAYYKIVTQINIDIPIINKILPGLRIFQVSGDTKTIVVG